MLEKASEYLGTDHSYRKTAEHEGMPIMYDDRTAAKERRPVGLAPSTVWRWLSWLGGMTRTLRAAWELIRQKEPNATLHREAVGGAVLEVPFGGAAGHAGAGHAVAGGRPRV